ncbi:CoxG family protein [Alcaligenes endophyticus]|uniref:Carbon monoxide dehydrogenase subunit G n=1 Tax=Alcaligenes endophyticus TaxID=1929088 RepID=A0ABT8EHJ3_9BURK|nr:carbon monoxide dehydrogenase subunit G [Alcaligenes endophyticus]MCX5592095.1 carbon monoxide dehydrogenase subunit G [Alcaligenes endophyticus]MDN4120742.1 carbon monoxide dehydrogenase subunit G [Alcaligenes endophyticus]
MEIKDERLIPGSLQATWDALNNPDVLKACIPGCESLEREGDDGFNTLVALKIGPVSARFKGRVKLTNIQAPRSYTLNFEGQGGVAGFGRGSADVELLEEGEQTLLKYNATAQVGGKMAQLGSRLIDATVQKLTDEFFSAFEKHTKENNVDASTVQIQVEKADAVAPVKSRAWWIVAATVVVILAWLFTAE